MIYVLSNPGSGPCAPGLEEVARRTLAAFIEELGLTPRPTVKLLGEEAGRYSFRLRFEGREVQVDMPARTRDELQLLPPGQGPLPIRLYVDGNSWWWPYALEQAREALLSTEED